MPITLTVKLCVVLLALFYCIGLSKKLGLLQTSVMLSIASHVSLKNLVLRFLGFALVSIIAMALLYPERLFYVVLNKPFLWLGISLFYSIFSVYPQEFLYRTFFFTRYETLFTSHWALIGTNALLFSFAHLFFANVLVLLLTLCGGVLFALTYAKTRSLMIVSIEHSMYGLWLYTLGMGKMLAFPG